MVDLNPVIDIGDGYCSVAVCNEGMVVCYTCIGCMFPKIAESFGFENICLVLVFSLHFIGGVKFGSLSRTLLFLY